MIYSELHGYRRRFYIFFMIFTLRVLMKCNTLSFKFVIFHEKRWNRNTTPPDLVLNAFRKLGLEEKNSKAKSSAPFLRHRGKRLLQARSHKSLDYNDGIVSSRAGKVNASSTLTCGQSQP